MFPSLSSLICCFCALLTHVVVSEDSVQTKWSNSWAVEIKGGQDVADQIAAKNDFINFGPVSCHNNYYNYEGFCVQSSTTSPAFIQII